MTKLEECARAISGAPFPSAKSLEKARAVIRCLMEPTEEMLFAADWQENGTQDAFRAMLQSVLDEKPE